MRRRALLALTGAFAVALGFAAQAGAAGLVGTGIARVSANPGHRVLVDDRDNEIPLDRSTAIRVVIRNSGDTDARRVRVTLTIQGPGYTKRWHKLVYRLARGARADVLFGRLAEPSDFELKFAVPSKLRFTVDPLPDESNLANNGAERPVIFTLA